MGIPLERYWDKYDLELYTYDFITNNHRKYTIKHGRPLGNPWDMEVSSWEIHRTKLGNFQQAMFDYRGVACLMRLKIGSLLLTFGQLKDGENDDEY